MSVRNWYVSEALSSFSRLNELLNDLTEEEVLECLKLEASSNRRGTIIDRLIQKAVRLNEMKYGTQLKEKYRGKVQHQDPDPRRTEDSAQGVGSQPKGTAWKREACGKRTSRSAKESND